MTGDVKGAIVHDASCLIDLSKGKLLRFVPKSGVADGLGLGR